MDQGIFNFLYIYATYLLLLVFTVSAVIALIQLRHLKLTRDVEFLRDYYERMIAHNCACARERIYDQVPDPVRKKDDHTSWLKDRRNKTELFHDIETELYELDFLGLFLRDAKINNEMALNLWSGVIARLTILLQHFIVEERKLRGKGYMGNFCWLARRNANYIASHHDDAEIKFYQSSKLNEGGFPVTFKEIETALSVLESSKPVQ